MSWQASEHVRQLRGCSAVERVILFVLADRHNVDDNGCWPRISLIAEDAEVDRSTVQRAIRRLERAGILTVTKRRRDDGTDTSNFFQFTGLLGGEGRRTPPPGRRGAAPGAVVAQPHESPIEPPREEEDRENDQAYEHLRPSEIFGALLTTLDHPVIMKVGNLPAYDAAFRGSFPGLNPKRLADFVRETDSQRYWLASHMEKPTPAPLVLPEAGLLRPLIPIANWLATQTHSGVGFRAGMGVVTNDEPCSPEVLIQIAKQPNEFLAAVQEHS